MATPKERITPKPKRQAASDVGVVRLPAPIVKVAAPQIKIDAPKVTVETAEFARALDDMAKQFNMALSAVLEQMQAQAKSHEQQMQKLLKAIADGKPPVVQQARRPRSFHVSVEKGNGETAEMRISADRSH